MAGKTTHMSTLKQVLQLHKSGVSNRSIGSQLRIYKETVNKYIRQFKALNIEVDTLLQKDDPELEYIFNGAAPTYVAKRFEDFVKRIRYLGQELNNPYLQT